MKKIVAICTMIGLMAGGVSAATEVVFSEGFNTGFSNPYSASWGAQFGVVAPGIITDGSIAGIEGDGFAGLNVQQPIGSPAIIGGMDVSLGTVDAAGVTYTFSGDFGWRFGSLTSASEVLLSYSQTGFLVGGVTHTKGDFIEFNFGTSTAGENQLTEHAFSYTTVAGDVGNEILVRVRLQDNSADGGLTQLLADNWRVTAKTVGVGDSADIVAGVRPDGLVYYYNPNNGSAGYVNNGAVVEDNNVEVGVVRGVLGYESDLYTFGRVDSGSFVGEYRVNYIPFSYVSNNISGDLSNQMFSRNILTNSVAANLVDFAYDGTDFWFLAEGGEVYQNSSTNSAFDFGSQEAGIYYSMSVGQTGLVAGVTSGAGVSHVVRYASGAFVTIYSQSAGATPGGKSLVTSTDSLAFVTRSDGSVYTAAATPDSYGNNSEFGGSPYIDMDIADINGLDSVLRIGGAGMVYYRDIGKSMSAPSLLGAPGSGSFIGMGVVQTIVPPSPGYEAWYVAHGLSLGAYGDDDGDGQLNVYEYGLGGDPTNSLDVGAAPTLVYALGDVVHFAHVELTDPSRDITYIVEQNDDLVLGQWTNSNWGLVVTNSVVDPDFDEVEHQTSGAGKDRLFLRLRITQP